MKNAGWFSMLSNRRPSRAEMHRTGKLFAAPVLAMASCIAWSQGATAGAHAADAQMSVPQGYSIHQAVDVGGRLNSTVGSEAMYDSLLNLHSGPRVLSESFEMHALPGRKHTLLDRKTHV